MKKKTSAGLLVYRLNKNAIEVLLVHPGGPFFKKRDDGCWSIPKGVIEEGEDMLDTAIRETKEETNIDVSGEFIELGTITQKGGKVVHAWGINYPLSKSFEFRSNTFEMEWPPASGKSQPFPEVDRAEFLDLSEASKKIKETQKDFLMRLSDYLTEKGLV
ncbi:MAG: NUDIX domain-containing protein [Ignavibacteriaceae bacterium]